MINKTEYKSSVSLTIHSFWFIPLFILSGLLLLFSACEKNTATISEAHESIVTYPFGDPAPIPVFADITNRRGNINIYPYFSFNQYSHDSEEQDWNVIRLENEFIEVSILPEVGGKIWGAIEKSSGRDFIYQNRVKKFRNIALRGPWASGGIEFNFGVIGHTPATSTPVDYITRQHEDGSVSTTVGALDLPSRTEWRVTITLPKDKAYFKTESFWYNPTPLEQSNYVWMNAAVEAKDDLQFFFPGQYHIGHQGDAHPWPVNEQGRDLSWYKNNDFGGSKSYHVLGEKSEFFGGYWHDENLGFGNWSLYNDMPGKKLWIWSLSRAGGIWEDLLTDEDGQYVEVQSGRLFSQVGGGTEETPFNHDALDVAASERWTEAWFPVKETGGISAATPYGVLHTEESGGKTAISLMALQTLDENLEITSGGEPISSSQIRLSPMDIYRDTLEITPGSDLRIVLGDHKLVYNSRKDVENFDRPMVTNFPSEEETAARYYQRAQNKTAMRDYIGGYDDFHTVLGMDPAYTDAHVGLANLYYRRGEYDNALGHALEALSYNTYDPAANHIYGLIKTRTGNNIQALEALGWAARSMQYRSGAYASMAEIYLETGRIERAIEFARRSLEFNQSNIAAYKILAIATRKQEETREANSVLDKLLGLDPLNHFANFELYLLDGSSNSLDQFNGMIRNELPHETYLELAVYYANLGLNDEAAEVLKQAPANPMVYYWLAWLQKEHPGADSREYLDRALSESPWLVFPFRPESIPVLQWANEEIRSWQNSYYLGLIYWSVGRAEDAIDQFDRVGDEPDYAPFYLLRGTLGSELGYESDVIYHDFSRALELDPDEWRTWHYLNDHYLNEGAWEQSLELSERAFNKFPDADAIAIDYGTALLYNGQYAASVSHLEEIRILPFYQAGGSRVLFEQANLFEAAERIHDGQLQEALHYLENAKRWPDNLAVGEPFDPDVRLQNFLIAAIEKELGNDDRAEELLAGVIDYTEAFPNRRGAGFYAAILTLRQNGQTGEAQQLLNQWQQSQPDNPGLRWAVAHFNRNTPVQTQLEQEYSEDLSFRLFTRSFESGSRLTGN
jgi:tetratricopeptide (TPR) repeat protein